MISLAPWYYRNLLSSNDLIEPPIFYEIDLLDGKKHYETNIFLKSELRPRWILNSQIYKNCDGTGTSAFKNVSVYKAISEALERLAFYQVMDSNEKVFAFDLNPTTTGLAAYPHWNCNWARKNAKEEAVERWAIHEFNKFHIPIVKHPTNIEKVDHYELKTPFWNIFVSLSCFKGDDFYAYSFAGGTSLKHSFDRSLIELNRNIQVLKKYYKSPKNEDRLLSATDKTLLYFSSEAGFAFFNELIHKSPRLIFNDTPKVLCDKELVGDWSKYTKVWRYLLEDSYFDSIEDKTFFMF